ncbi:MAG: histidine kinase [Bacteroidales bacterium]|nr:histidine kinase [Bacteroidales bacterium]
MHFILSYFGFIIVFSLLISLPYEYFGVNLILNENRWSSFEEYVKLTFLWTIVVQFMITGLASTIKIAKNWLWVIQEKQRIEKDKIEIELKLRESELKFLKAQIHPHFLFNTLNNLYGLTLEKSDMASEVVVKLSEMLDYMLYECNENLVPLEKEIKLLENYIALEKIRHDESLDIALTIDGQLKNLKIAPLILLPFIENAFKHGMSKQSDNKWLHINIKVEDLILKYSVNNSKELAENIANQVSEGIGLENLKKRLGLQYKNDFKLDIINSENEFKAYLELKLAS